MGHSRVMLTEEVFLIRSEEKERERISGECSSTSLEPAILEAARKNSFLPGPWTGGSHVASRNVSVVSVFLFTFLLVPHCSLFDSLL